MKILPDDVVANLDRYADEIRKAIVSHDLMQAFYDYSVEFGLGHDTESWNKMLRTLRHDNDEHGNMMTYEWRLLIEGKRVIDQYYHIVHRFHHTGKASSEYYSNSFDEDFLKSYEIYHSSDKSVKDTENTVQTVAEETVYMWNYEDLTDEEVEELLNVDYEPTCPPIIPERDRAYLLDFHRTLKHLLATETADIPEEYSNDKYELTFDNERTLKINGVKIHDVNRGSEAHRILMQAFKNGGLNSVMLFNPRIRNLQQTMLNIGLPKDIQGLFFPVLHDEGGNFHNPVSQAELKKAGLSPLDLSQFQKLVNV